MDIARHEHGWEPKILLEQLDYSSEDLEDSLAYVTKKPGNLSSLMRSALNYAGYLSVLEPSSIELKRALTIAANTSMSIFDLADLSITEEYDLYVGEGQAFSFPQTGPTGSSNCYTWEIGYYLAFACREKHVLDSLVKRPTDIARRSSLISNEYDYLMVDALKSFYNSSVHNSCEPDTLMEDTVQKLTTALKATDPNEIMESTIDAMLNLVVPAMEMIFRLLEGDSQAFNAALEKALNLHKKHFSSDEKMSGDPQGFIAIAPLGITCYAYDAGFPIEVESDYIPKYIVEKQYLSNRKAS